FKRKSVSPQPRSGMLTSRTTRRRRSGWTGAGLGRSWVTAVCLSASDDPVTTIGCMSDTAARPAIVLTSGGLDSTTCMAIARDAGFAPLYSLSFDYGQRHRQELDAAARVAKDFGVAEHRVIKIDLRQFGGSAL